MTPIRIKVLPEIEELVHQIGSFIEYWGFKRIQGQIWAHLVLSPEPLDAAAMMARLHVTKGFISISLKEMIEYQVIEEVGKSEHGTILYRANPDQTSVILNVLRRREKMMISRISNAQRMCMKISADELQKTKISESGLKKLESMVTSVESALDSVINLGEIKEFKLSG